MQKVKRVFIFILSFLFLIGCSTNSTQSQYKAKAKSDDIIFPDEDYANIISVITKGNENSFTFSIGIKSPDKGCKQYANWWEVISESGQLIYRRILAHSHVNEQPFIRSGGPVKISNSQTVIIRGHMNTTGYGTKVYKGSVNNGFTEIELNAKFAENLEQQEPLPQDCAF